MTDKTTPGYYVLQVMVCRACYGSGEFLDYRYNVQTKPPVTCKSCKGTGRLEAYVPLKDALDNLKFTTRKGNND
jgi:DnaJ-class molecular chaperone